MVITNDFNIFADKYHNKQHLPCDIINMIMNINTDIIKREKIKQQHKNKFKWVVNLIDEFAELSLEKCSFLKDENNIEFADNYKSTIMLFYINFNKSNSWYDSEDEDEYDSEDDY